MDSLLASYASSDEDEDQPQPQPQSKPQHHPLPSPSSTASSLFSSLPTPQSSSSSSFSALPPPKKVIQFHPPLPQSSKSEPKHDDDNDEDEEEKEKERKNKRQPSQDTTVKSFLSSMPTPKFSLGSGSALGAPPSSGSGRRSIIETEEPAPSISDTNDVNTDVGFESNLVNGQENWVDGSHSYGYNVGVSGEHNYAGHEGYGDYDNYGSYGQYGAGWYNASVVPETSTPLDSFVNMGGTGKRRRDQAPTEIVEVKQDELMKDRPREDKSRLTGIAFGPSYQPASTKGKPSKLHKRKHQIGALYFDMKQKEMELAERRSKGLLTKAETQAKYGW